jgi:hypothetical protein
MLEMPPSVFATICERRDALSKATEAASVGGLFHFGHLMPVPLTEGSTRPVKSTVTHAGIVKVKRYVFDIP